ncbi:MAG: anion permease [Chloroflexales bacterium]|nr:anion permease [Chloroflexales bacterium]
MQHRTFFPSTQDPVAAPRLRLRRGDALAMVIGLPSIVAIALLPDHLSLAIKIALSMVVLTVVSWTFTKLNTTLVALVAATVLILSATISVEAFFDSVSNSSVWLLFGACIVTGALYRTSIITRLTVRAVRAAHSVETLFYQLTVMLLITALIIPSSAVRATLMLPIYQALVTVLRDKQITRALALMLPINIMLTAMASLVGAGAHMVIIDTLGQLTGHSISFGAWVLLGMPFAALSAFGSTALILSIFLSPEQRHRSLNSGSFAALPKPSPFTRQERYVSGVTVALILLLATEWLHGIPAILILLFSTLALLVPNLSVLSLKDAAQSVAWELILFVVATLALSTALVETGAQQWLMHLIASDGTVLSLGMRLTILGAAAIVALTAHIFIASRAVRGAVLAPLTLLLAYSLGFDPTTMALVTAAGIGYCLTLAGADNPLTQFQQPTTEGRPPFTAADLNRLNSTLAPMHFGLILAFGLLYWPTFGLGGMTAPVQAASINVTQPDSLARDTVATNSQDQAADSLTVSGEPTFVFVPSFPAYSTPTPAPVAPALVASISNEPVPNYQLTITTVNGRIRADPPRESYLAGQEIQLTAFPDQGYYFAGWMVNDESCGDANPIPVRIEKDTIVIAYFSLLPPGATNASANPINESQPPPAAPQQPAVESPPPPPAAPQQPAVESPPPPPAATAAPPQPTAPLTNGNPDNPGNSGGNPGNSGGNPGNSGGNPGNSGGNPGNSGGNPGNSGNSGGNPGNPGRP